MVADLSSRPFWLANLEHPLLHQNSALPDTTDVVVIGGGLTGVSTAYWLNTLGISVTLLERGGLASGATGRNGGHVVFGPNQSFSTSVRAIGLEPTLALWDFTKTSVALLRQFIETHQINCDLHFTPWVTLALTAEQEQDLRESYRLMAAYGLATDFWERDYLAQKIHSTYFRVAMVEPLHAQVWPARLVLGIAQVAVQQGAMVCANTTVQSVQRGAKGLVVRTDRGDLHTGAVVYATNAFAHHLLPELKDVIIPVRGQVLATAPLPRLWEFDWLANDGYEYAIQRQDGRLVLGGMRRQAPGHEIGIEDETTIEPNVSQGLRQFLKDAFGSLIDVPIDYEWTGIMAYTPDENPLIGRLSHRPGEYIAAGYTGHGMSVGFLAGKALAEAIYNGGTNLIPQAFAPGRYGL
jgi:gamma-glutamylputrescine oxidase